MKALKINPAIFTLLLLLLGNVLFAQQENNEKPKKVVIITKTIDDNGKETTKKTVKEVSADEDLIIQHGSEEGQEINVDVNATDSKKRIKIKIIKDGDADDMEVIEWEGDGEIPADLQKQLEENGINLNIEEEGNVFYFDTDDAPNNACLGVMIGSTVEVENINGEETTTTAGASDLGVPVLDIIDGSGAQDAGLAKDDIITSINGAVVTSIDDVLEILEPFEAGANVSVAYLRDGQARQVTATLKACGNTDHLEIEEEIEWMGDDNEGDNNRKVMIIKRKDGDEEIVEEITLDDEDLDFSSDLERTLDLQTIDIFPNPTEGKLTLQFSAPAESTTVKILDAVGREIYLEQLNNFDGTFNKIIDLGSAADGILILSIHQKDKVFSEKIILQK